MFWVVVIGVVVLVVLFCMGVFRAPSKCQNCGVELKGTEQKLFNESEPFCLCKNCANKIHPQLMEYAKKNWTYVDYTNYLEWDESTKEERARFKPDVTYGKDSELQVDTIRGLFSIYTYTKEVLVFRFADLMKYDLNLMPEEYKEGVLGDKIKGKEYITVEFATPRVYLEEVIRSGAKVKVKNEGVIVPKYKFEFSKGFSEVVRAFTICAYIEAARRQGEYQRGGEYQKEAVSVGEVEKALALFMFDSMEEVTKESLKKQRNALIKAFHPDNAEENEKYSQKINAAYDLLSGIVRE